MVASVAGIHLSGNHAGRPTANTVPDGSLYSCTTHALVYKSDYAGNSWSTWADLSGTGTGEILTKTTSETDTSLVLHPDGAGGVEWGTDATGGGGFPLGLAAGDTIPGTPGAMDEEFEGTADTLPTNWAWVSAAPTFSLNSKLPSWLVIERADTTERKLRRSSFVMAATSGLWVKFGNGSHAAVSSQFEFIIYDSTSANGYGFGVHNGNVWLARQAVASVLANRGTYTSGDRGHAAVMGVMRVSNTWQTWMSLDGIHFFQIQSADSQTFTVDRLELRWSSDSSIKQRGTVDWIRYRTDNLFPEV